MPTATSLSKSTARPVCCQRMPAGRSTHQPPQPGQGCQASTVGLSLPEVADHALLDFAAACPWPRPPAGQACPAPTTGAALLDRVVFLLLTSQRHTAAWPFALPTKARRSVTRPDSVYLQEAGVRRMVTARAPCNSNTCWRQQLPGRMCCISKCYWRCSSWCTETTTECLRTWPLWGVPSVTAVSASRHIVKRGPTGTAIKDCDFQLEPVFHYIFCPFRPLSTAGNSFVAFLANQTS